MITLITVLRNMTLFEFIAGFSCCHILAKFISKQLLCLIHHLKLTQNKKKMFEMLTDKLDSKKVWQAYLEKKDITLENINDFTKEGEVITEEDFLTFFRKED